MSQDATAKAEPKLAASTTKPELESAKEAPRPAFFSRGLSAWKEANPYAKPNREALGAAAGATLKGWEAAGAEALAFAQQAYQDNVEAASRLTQVRSVADLVDLQRDYANTVLAAYVNQAGKLNELAANAAKDIAASFGGRASAVASQLRSPAE